MTHFLEVLDDATDSVYLGGITGRAGLDASYRARPPFVRMLERRSSKNVAVGEVGPAQQNEDLDLSDVRLDKVAALKAQIENGTYDVSTADLVDRLISSLTR